MINISISHISKCHVCRVLPTTPIPCDIFDLLPRCHGCHPQLFPSRYHMCKGFINSMSSPSPSARKSSSPAVCSNYPGSPSMSRSSASPAQRRLGRRLRNGVKVPGSRKGQTGGRLAPYYAMAADIFADDNMLTSTLNSDLDVSFLKAARVSYS